MLFKFMKLNTIQRMNVGGYDLTKDTTQKRTVHAMQPVVY